MFLRYYKLVAYKPRSFYNVGQYKAKSSLTELI